MLYLSLFLNFLKIGFFTIGGGYAMIPLIGDTAIPKGWITEDMLYNFIAIAESTPGPFAVNVATFIGYDVGGILGVLCTVGGLFVPSFAIMLAIYYLSKKVINNIYVQDAFRMIRPAVTALILAAFVSVMYATVAVTDAATGETSFNWFGLVWAAVCFFVMLKVKKVHPILLIIISAGVGILVYGVIGL